MTTEGGGGDGGEVGAGGGDGGVDNETTVLYYNTGRGSAVRHVKEIKMLGSINLGINFFSFFFFFPLPCF